MRRLLIVAVLVLTSLTFVSSASADYGLNNFDVTFTNEDGTPATQAGSHPYAMTTAFNVNYTGTLFSALPEGDIDNLIIQQVDGFTGSATAVPQCSTTEFLEVDEGIPLCHADTVVGQIAATLNVPIATFVLPIFNLTPPPGVVTRLGFDILGVEVTIDVGVKGTPKYNLIAPQKDLPQVLKVFSVKFQLWGNPESPSHDHFRGRCGATVKFGALASETEFAPGENACSVTTPEKPFLTLPRACGGPATTYYETSAWQDPTRWVGGSAVTHDGASPPNPQGFTGCGKLQFKPSITSEPTTKAAQSPTGLDFSLNVHDEGITSPDGLAQSDIEKSVVTLPEGMSVNPSIAEGLEVCSEADLARETPFSQPGDGCPNASKIGTVEVESPLVDENVNGALYQATPYDNPFHSLIALYIVIKNPTLGIIVRQPLNVIPDPVTGQLTTVAEDMPQLPFSHFKLHFREGTRSPLSSPPTCGDHSVKAVLYPYSGSAPITTTSTFEIISGANNGPCPKGGLPPFKPELQAGTINNAAGRFSDFNVRMSRNDGEQEITHFSIKLPPGISGKLAGIPYCTDAQIAQAISRTGPLGGHEEQANPSCPAASEIGHTLVGSGVGPALTYAPGKLYLAGPYHGAPISMVAITSGIVGPFDIGTVVVRQGFKIDPETAEVFLDSTGSDPIPHIIKGVPVHLRDIRAYVDRPEFTLNPTDCDRTSTASTVLGSGLDFGSEADDNPITVTSPFQAADCAALPFNPKLSLKLLGGTKRGAHPRFRATLKMNGIGEAAIQRAQVTLPHSEFLENAHIKTICTRVQFKAGAGNGAQCPAGSVYGYAKAVTPILDGALTGPVFLRSSEHQLPDLVAALHSPQGIDFDLVGRIDSVKGGGIRNTFEAAPDAPVSSFVLTMQGGKKGLLVNSTNLCKGTHKAQVEFDAHSGKVKKFAPALKAKCATKAKKKSKRSR